MNTQEYNTREKLSDHDDFFITIDWKREKIYPELAEIAEHIVLWFDKHPEFKNKIINCEYDMLIGDDVSGRPVTLMLKHIIDHFREQNWLKWGVENIFIDNAHATKVGSNIIYSKQIKKNLENKRILITTEFIYEWRSIEAIIRNLWINQQDVFTQVLGKKYKEKDLSKVIHYQIINNKDNIYNVLYGCTAQMPPKIYDNTHWDKENLVGLISQEEPNLFSHKLPPKIYNQELINKVRHQIKILWDYIIDQYLNIKKTSDFSEV